MEQLSLLEATVLGPTTAETAIFPNGRQPSWICSFTICSRYSKLCCLCCFLHQQPLYCITQLNCLVNLPYTCVQHLLYNPYKDRNADCFGCVFRRVLLSADCLSDNAILFGSVQVNTPSSRSSALLSLVTLPDQRVSDDDLDFIDIHRTTS